MVKLCKTALACSILVSVASSASIVGTNIGGWQVLEPWITPSLFYRFLGKTATEGVGMDSWTMCEALGPVEGNKLMRAHWDSWLTEDHLEGLAERGVQMVRLPIGDWTLRQYGPYVGCMDGAADKIQWFLDTCQKHGLKVLIDSTVQGSMRDTQSLRRHANPPTIESAHGDGKALAGLAEQRTGRHLTVLKGYS
jgi:aryl-phospho-beta-D-glucosidase BglC (GH1 family)